MRGGVGGAPRPPSLRCGRDCGGGRVGPFTYASDGVRAGLPALLSPPNAAPLRPGATPSSSWSALPSPSFPLHDRLELCARVDGPRDRDKWASMGLTRPFPFPTAFICWVVNQTTTGREDGERNKGLRDGK